MALYVIQNNGVYVVDDSQEEPIWKVVIPAIESAKLDSDCIEAIEGRVEHAHGLAILSERDFGTLVAKIRVLQWENLQLKKRGEHGIPERV